MKKEFLRFTLYAIIVYLTVGTLNPVIAITQPSGEHETHFCGVSDYHPLWRQHSKRQDNRNYARRFATNLNIGEPRTVRMIYFLPNDRPYRAEFVQQMKDEIRTVQDFFAEQMEAHGYGRTTFHVETDAQGEPIVHRVDGQYPDSHYLDDTHVVYDELREVFDYLANVYLTFVDNSTNQIDRRVTGTGSRRGKQGGGALISQVSGWLIAHELGHAFGLHHDFRGGAYIMSSGDVEGAIDEVEEMKGVRLSQCHAEYLSVHPYFNLDTPIKEDKPPTIKLISPRTYPPGSTSVPVQIQVNDSDGLHQVLLHAAQPDGRGTVKSCRGFSGEQSATVEFDYDGVIPSTHDPVYSNSTSLLSPLVHPIVIEAIDMNGDVDSSMEDGYFDFVLFSDTLEPLSKISGDNLQGLPNTPLPVPFVVELRNLDDGFPRHEVWVTFTVTAGGGRLSVERVMTDENGRSESTLTLGSNFGINTVEVSAEGLTVTFNAVAGAPVDIPDPNLRAAIETAIGVLPGTPIAPADLASLTYLGTSNANISDLTGLEQATNLMGLWTSSVSDLSPLAGLTNLIILYLGGSSASDLSYLAGLTNLELLSLDGIGISNLSPLSGLTNLTGLNLSDNNISDISAVAGLTNLTGLSLQNNAISDISPLVRNAGLGNGDTVNVQGNPLNRTSIKIHIPALQSRGVTVEFDNRLEMGPNKITGPWLWMIAPTAPGQGGRQSNNVDSLAAASGGDVTEAEVAANGAKEGKAVGNYVWTLGKIARTGGNNINDLINSIGMAQGDVDDHSSYALITLESVTAQSNVTMQVGSDDSIKVWLNGEVVHNKPVNRGASDFKDSFKVNLKKGDNLLLVKVSERAGGWSMFVGIEADVNAIYKRPPDVVIYADVNGDGLVNVLDLTMIASSLGESGQNDADVNRDGVVSILDLVLAAGLFEGAAAAPSAQRQVPETLTAVEVQGWLTDALSLEVKDVIIKRGVMVLEQLLVSLTPRETELLANYPNPFNPETWIPYRLAEDAVVTLTIYDREGQVVRTLDVGHRIAAAYESQPKALHWDGKNDLGEGVASGIYFYTLSAGDYSATRKMVILK